ncbi:hypothetical protein JHW33_23280 (plasmid) [Rahnella aceris]|uniref:hypothetical protein n=1 Tax=Rahnella sp. (strain Y9602) TaxID=2703885 RepID=UPI001903B6AE|nr:hypothetical protein [Rahnella aceris]QQN37433.1 hypothetical protein JHW33_23280 [Rahnella aceris]
MHTQNVKTAAPESSERWGAKTTTLRMDGFITDISSPHPFDVIRADVVISRLEKQAHAGCGLHYEIYESRLIGSALDHLSRLPMKDRPVFIGTADRRGITLTWAAEEKAQNAYCELMAEIAAEQE